MGGPSEKDTHPLHGELPNVPYQTAFIFTGSDEVGDYIGLGGQYQYTVAFSFNYLAEPRLTLHADASTFKMQMTITNLKKSPMELMYLAHINFRPADNGRLVYSAIQTPEHVRVRTSIPSHIKPGPGYVEFIDKLRVNPEKHHILGPGLTFDPEIVFFIDYLADKRGWAHTLHLHPDGNADYVSHRPSQLNKGIRWLCRTADQDALGMIEPATAEPEGYLYVFSTDPKVIGIQYAVTGLLYLLFGFGLMLLMRWQLAFPGQPLRLLAWLGEARAPGGVMLPEFYNELGAMHGTIMVCLGVVPLAVGGFGNFALPLQIGAPDMAFPRLNMASYWSYFAGGVVMLLSFLVPGGAAQSGWTSYAPLSVLAGSGQTWWLFGMVFLITSSLLGHGGIAHPHRRVSRRTGRAGWWVAGVSGIARYELGDGGGRGAG